MLVKYNWCDFVYFRIFIYPLEYLFIMWKKNTCLHWVNYWPVDNKCDLHDNEKIWMLTLLNKGFEKKYSA